MRILQALSISTIGGTEQMVLQLVSHMDQSLSINHVSFLDSTGPVAERFRRLGVQVHRLDGRGRPVSCLWRMVGILRAHRYDIVHLYGFRVSLIGRIAAQLVRPRPIVIHGIRGLHVTGGEEVSSRKTRCALAIERLGASLVDAYLANSRGAVDFLCSQGLPREKFSVIPNGIDVSEWDEQTVRPVREMPEIICVANFRLVKRHRDLIEALALLLERQVRIRCLFVGDGPTKQEAESLAQARHLNEAIEFLGRREPEEVRALLRRADIFVLPSLWEGLPGSVMEAMATGLPVVGTDVNGTNELVINGETGYLVPPRNPEALAERLAWLATNPHLRTEMGQRGRKRIAEEFTLEAMVKRTEAFYQSAIQNRLLERGSPG
jgi:glycosyltransferase involved in cell wall biosynthesis